MKDEIRPHGFERELGELSARLVHVETDVTSIKSDMREVRDTLVSAKGGWKTLVVTGAIAGSIGALLAKVLPFFFLK